MPSARTTSTNEKACFLDLRIGEETAWGFLGGIQSRRIYFVNTGYIACVFRAMVFFMHFSLWPTQFAEEISSP
jgi:hypothetical protein